MHDNFELHIIILYHSVFCHFCMYFTDSSISSAMHKSSNWSNNCSSDWNCKGKQFHNKAKKQKQEMQIMGEQFKRTSVLNATILNSLRKHKLNKKRTVAMNSPTGMHTAKCYRMHMYRTYVYSEHIHIQYIFIQLQ